MVGPGVPCKIKLSDELWSASQKRSTSAKWRFFRRRRRSVATKLLTAHHVVRDGMTSAGGPILPPVLKGGGFLERKLSAVALSQPAHLFTSYFPFMYFHTDS